MVLSMVPLMALTGDGIFTCVVNGDDWCSFCFDCGIDGVVDFDCGFGDAGEVIMSDVSLLRLISDISALW